MALIFPSGWELNDQGAIIAISEMGFNWKVYTDLSCLILSVDLQEEIGIENVFMCLFYEYRRRSRYPW